MLFYEGPDLSINQEDHIEDPTHLLSYGYCYWILNGHRHGGKFLLDPFID